MASARPSLNQTIVGDFSVWAREAPARLDSLYRSPYAVQCVLRALPPVARLYVARVAFLPAGTPFAPGRFRDALQRRARARDRHAAALSVLRDLRIFLSVAEGEGAAQLCLHEDFGAQLRAAATGGVGGVFGGEVGGGGGAAELDEFSAAGLEGILNFAIGNEGGAEVGEEVRRALDSTGILVACDGGRSMRISNLGFQFLLKDANAQVWALLRDVIRVGFRGAEFEALDVVFMVSFARVGRTYSTAGLSDVQRRAIGVLHELGVVRASARGVFEPTPLGVGLVSSASREAEDGTAGMRVGRAENGDADIRVIVETNFRVYAYTTSAFQTNLLSLFTHMRYQLPNLVVGHLTREKVRDAFMNGITADQIIGFLNAHGHPRMKNCMIPTTVRDEIKLWEAEQERVQFDDGVLMTEFASVQAFENVLAFAKDVSGCLWFEPTRKQIVVAKREYDRVREFVRSSSANRR